MWRKSFGEGKGKKDAFFFPAGLRRAAAQSGGKGLCKSDVNSMMEQRRLFVNKRQSCFLNIQRYREGATARSAVAPSLLEERKQNGEFQAKKLFLAIRRIEEFIGEKRRVQQIGRVDFRYFCNLEKCFRRIITRCLRRDDALKALFFHYTPSEGRRRCAASSILGENGAYVLSVSSLFSSGENGSFSIIFFLLFTDALRRCAAQGVGSIVQGKFNYG